MQEQLAQYIDAAVARRSQGVRRLWVYVALAMLLAAASLMAVNGRGGPAAKFPLVLVPGSSAGCTAPPNGFLFSKTVDGTQMKVCISQEGNINQVSFPDTAAGHTQIAWDGYCLLDRDTTTAYRDYSPGSPVTSSGWGPATLTQTASNSLNMARTSTDNKFQLTEFIKINFQPRSIFVGMTVKNVDPASMTHNFFLTRSVAPAIDGSAADDQYNEFGVGSGGGVGRTGQAFQSPGPGTNSLLFGPTQNNGVVLSEPTTGFASDPGCSITHADPVGYIAGGNRVLRGNLFTNFSLAPKASVSVGNFVYRMI